MNTILIVALVAAGLGLVIILFKLFKKAGKIASKLPTNFLLHFLFFALVGLSGFLLRGQVVEKPVLLGLLVLIISLAAGTLLTYNLYEKWEWSREATLGKKIGYFSGIVLTSMVGFAGSFLLCEHRGWPSSLSGKDLVWWLTGLILGMSLPLIIKILHELWNRVPKKIVVKPSFELPLDAPPPFIETGGASIHFYFIIPLDYNSKDIVRSEVAVPYNKTLAEVFHYKLHEHNVIKRFRKRIVLAKDNQRSRVYGWCFYRPKKIWWGWWTKKSYLNPHSKVGGTIIAHEHIYVERMRSWLQ